MWRGARRQHWSADLGWRLWGIRLDFGQPSHFALASLSVRLDRSKPFLLLQETNPHFQLETVRSFLASGRCNRDVRIGFGRVCASEFFTSSESCWLPGDCDFRRCQRMLQARTRCSS